MLQWLQLWLVPVWLWDQGHLVDGTGPQYGQASGEGPALTPAALLTEDVYHLLPTPLVRQNDVFHMVLTTQTIIYSHSWACCIQSSSLRKMVLEKHSQAGGDWTSAWWLINMLSAPKATRFSTLCMSQILWTPHHGAELRLMKWTKSAMKAVETCTCMYELILRKTINKASLWWGRELFWSSLLSITASSNTFLHHVVTAHLERHS